MRERLYIANLALVPVFFSSLNVLSVLKLWSDRADDFFNPTNTPLSDESVICWELQESSRPLEFSSMNFISQNGSQPEIAGKQLTDILEKYFRIGYWSFPKYGFSPSTHFLFGRTRISSQVKISKSLYYLESIGPRREFEIEGKTVEALEVRMRGLAEKNGQYFFSRFPAFMDVEIADQLVVREHPESSFINGIVAEVVRSGGRKFSLMTVVADYGESHFDILQALIGIVADARYSKAASLTEIGTVGELREGTYDLYLDIQRNLRISATLSDAIPNLFDVALTSMFPVLFVDGEKVMMVHPMIWGFLNKWNLIREDEAQQREILVHLLKLMEASRQIKSSRIFLDRNLEFFWRKGLKKIELLQSVVKLARTIEFCKMMRTVHADRR